MAIDFDSTPLDLAGNVVAVVGGDEREQEISRLAATTGAEVRAFGFPWPEGGVPGVTLCPDARSALEGARFALFPIPGLGMDGSLFSPEKIVPDRDLLSVMAPGAHIILGTPDHRLEAACEALGITLHEYETDRELMLLRMPAIVEAAVRAIIENTPFTIHKSRVCVVGQGNIGGMLCRTLHLMGAYVHVAARNAVQRANAATFGVDTLTLDALQDLAPRLDIVLSTVPAPVVTPAIIDRLPAHALVMDLSAPPGGCDLEYARNRGLKAVWARGLGRRAPMTVGRSQWKGISQRIAEILGGGA